MADRLGPGRRALWARREVLPDGNDPLPEPVDSAGPDCHGPAADELLATLSRRCEALAARQQEQLDRLADGQLGAEEGRVVRHLVHLARQVGRTGADLRVLAGQDAVQHGDRPRALLDVLEAAAAEVRGYRQVVVRRPPQLTVETEVAHDLVHLLADLLYIVASWSARGATVTLTAARSQRGGAVVGLDAPGPGMSPAQLRGVNAVLAGPGDAGTSTVPTGSVGLVVVGRLAARHAVTAEAQQGVRGVVAVVEVPPGCLSELTGVAPLRGVDTSDVAATREAPGVDVTGVDATALPSREPSTLPLIRPEPEPQPPPSVVEQWAELFGRRLVADPPGRHAAPAGDNPHSRWFAPAEDAAAPAWVSVGDAGWLAAVAVQEAAPPDTTPAGLPRRQRGARLLPGSVAPGPQPVPVRSAESVRGRLDSYRRGLSRGRHALREPDEQQ